MPRALVTGGSGFLGTHLADALAGAGYDVRTLDILPAGPSRYGHERVLADVRDGDAVARAVSGCDVVVDNAARVPISRSSLAEYREVNVAGCEHTLEAARQVGAYVLHISSSSIYGVTDQLPVTGATPLAPIETYGQSKMEAEAVVEARRSHDFPIASLRPRALMGPGRLGMFDIMFSRVRAGKRVPLLGAGNTIQLCHVDDFCAAALLAIEQRSNGTFNIAAEDFSSAIRDDIEALIAAVGSDATVFPIPVAAGRVLLPPLALAGVLPLTAWHWRAAPSSFWCEVETVTAELGWQPRYSNREALVAAYEHWLDRASDSGPSAHSAPMPGLVARLLRR